MSAYNGTEIHQFGLVSFPCRYKENWVESDFYVVDTNSPAILGLSSSRQMKLISLNCAVRSEPERHISDKRDLQTKYPDRFEGIGKFPGKHHLVVREDAQPVVHSPRRTPIHLTEELHEELKHMEDLDVIRKISEPTDWVSSIALSRKSNGHLRVCLDPRDLNKALKRTHHRTPTLEEITFKLSGAQVFSKLDARHGYWSVVLDDESSLLTTFNSPHGRFCYKRLPFGLNVSQDIFQAKMDVIIDQCTGVINIADDIIVFGATEAEHDDNLSNLMQRARDYGLVFNGDKCDIKIQRIKFFGCYYDKDGIHPDPAKVASIRALSPPENVKELQQLLGMAQYLSPFVPHLADHTATLRDLTKKDIEWQWTSSHQKAFEDLKDKIEKATSLTYFDTSKPTVVQVDASMKGLGAALLQDGKPVAFASKASTPTEQRYANIERELLAVVFGCTRFHTYVSGSKFTVETDHKPLESIQYKNLAETPPRLQRMMLRLQPYDLHIVYRPGTTMLLADALSRLNPVPGQTLEVQLDETIHAIRCTKTKLQEIRDLTEADDTIRRLALTITEGWLESAKDLHNDLRSFWSCRESFSLEDGIIMKGDKIFIPPPTREEVLEKIHIGHQGITKSQAYARTSVYWPGMDNDVEGMCRSCPQCQSH